MRMYFLFARLLRQGEPQPEDVVQRLNANPDQHVWDLLEDAKSRRIRTPVSGPATCGETLPGALLSLSVQHTHENHPSSDVILTCQPFLTTTNEPHNGLLFDRLKLNLRSWSALSGTVRRISLTRLLSCYSAARFPLGWTLTHQKHGPSVRCGSASLSFLDPPYPSHTTMSPVVVPHGWLACLSSTHLWMI